MGEVSWRGAVVLKDSVDKRRGEVVGDGIWDVVSTGEPRKDLEDNGFMGRVGWWNGVRCFCSAIAGYDRANKRRERWWRMVSGTE